MKDISFSFKKRETVGKCYYIEDEACDDFFVGFGFGMSWVSLCCLSLPILLLNSIQQGYVTNEILF